ncbi:hypothetical protein ACTG16_21700 [Aeromonas sp. 23P]|uniref:hypothetical protein n=1 Tax=Aeromonas sp. 23P TaxID=3452716 RepID=UPI003F7950E2
MNKAEAVDYIAQVKVNMVAISALIENFFSDDVDLHKHQSMHQLTSDLHDIKDGMIRAEMLIGVATSKLADIKGNDVDNIAEEIAMLRNFNESLRKVKDPLVHISGVIDAARSEAGESR